LEYESALKVIDPVIHNGGSKTANVFGKTAMLTIYESPFKLKERTVAIIDPKVMKYLLLST
jgi:hypothetical protein